MNSKKSIETTLRSARLFVGRRPADARVSRTFTYFTDHPVSRLNQARLLGLLDCAAAESRRLGRPLTILDLACGGGLIANALALDGHDVLGFDLDPAEVDLAREFSSLTGSRARFETADLIAGTQWKAQVESLLGRKPDAVILAYALHHLPEVEHFVRGLGKWLPPGALLIINEENPWSPLFRIKHWVRSWLQNDTEAEWHRTTRAWRSLLRQEGFLTGKLQGRDPIPLLSVVAPFLCWSVLFEARRA